MQQLLTDFHFLKKKYKLKLVTNETPGSYRYHRKVGFFELSFNIEILIRLKLKYIKLNQ